MEMRRKELAVTDPAKIDAIIQSCDCIRLAFADGTHPYIVPLSFGYVREGDTAKFYFHGAANGRKVDLSRKLAYAGFELDRNRTLKTDPKACDFSFAYESVVGEGSITELTTREEKAAGLAVIMAHYSGRTDWDFPEGVLDRTCVFCLTVTEISGRAHG